MSAIINRRFKVVRQVPVKPFEWYVPNSDYVRVDHDSVQPADLEAQVHQRYDAERMVALLKDFDRKKFAREARKSLG